MKMPLNRDKLGREDPQEVGISLMNMIVALIHKRSAAAQLTSESEILSAVHDRLLVCADVEAGKMDDVGILDRLIAENEDLQRIIGQGPPYYYSFHFMTEAYAQLLVLKHDGALPLIAGTVRRHAGIWQRPISLDVFTQPPFSLERHQILDALAIMAETEGYGDIAMTTTSTDGVYLYATSHLEDEHAAMLAEWLDVGQFENP